MRWRDPTPYSIERWALILGVAFPPVAGIAYAVVAPDYSAGVLAAALCGVFGANAAFQELVLGRPRARALMRAALAALIFGFVFATVADHGGPFLAAALAVGLVQSRVG